MGFKLLVGLGVCILLTGFYKVLYHDDLTNLLCPFSCLCVVEGGLVTIENKEDMVHKKIQLKRRKDYPLI